MQSIIFAKISWLGSWQNYFKITYLSFHRNTLSKKSGYIGIFQCTIRKYISKQMNNNGDVMIRKGLLSSKFCGNTKKLPSLMSKICSIRETLKLWTCVNSSTNTKKIQKIKETKYVSCSNIIHHPSPVTHANRNKHRPRTQNKIQT